MADDLTSSTDGLAVKAAEAGGEQQSVEEYQADDHGEQGEMRKLRDHCRSQTFAGVDKRIYEHGFLEDREFLQGAPRIISATKENHGRNDQAEHQADVGLLHATAEGEATGGGEKSYQHGHNREEEGMGHVQIHAGAEEQPGGGDDHEPGSERLQRARDNFLNSQPGDFHGSEQTVFDFARELKFGNQRHGDGPDARADHADGHDSREQQALVGRRHVAAADHDAAEDEYKHQRLQESLKEQRHEVAASDVGIARKHGEKGFPVHSRKLLPVWCKKRFSKLGSEICTSHNSTPAAEARLATSATSDPPRSAYKSVPSPSEARTSRTPDSAFRRSRSSGECWPKRRRSKKP